MQMSLSMGYAEAMSTENPKVPSRKATISDMRDVSRLVAQRILLSSASKFLEKRSYDAVSKAFLSENPQNSLDLQFKVLESGGGGSYYDRISDLALAWTEMPGEFLDEDGSAWKDFCLSARATISSCYDPAQFNSRVDCLVAIDDLISEIRSVSDIPLRIMQLNKEQRESRDKENRTNAAFETFRAAMQGPLRNARKGMRKHGPVRPLPQEIGVLFEPGSYEIDINDGSVRYPRVKRYRVQIPENRMKTSRFNRIS